MPNLTSDTTGAWRSRAHRTAKNFNWDYGCDKLREIIRQRCDLGTALLIYWSGRPDFYRHFKRRSDLTLGHNVFDMLVEIERNVVEGFYTYRNIPFNPFDYEGQNWCRDPKRDVYCELPEAMYRGVGSPEEIAQRKPLRTGISGLPIGLSALVEADPIPQNDLERAIAYLNSLNDNTASNIVQQSNGTVTGISFFSNRRASDADLHHLKWFPNLRCLDLGPEMTDQALENLRFVPNLRVLKLVDNPITDDGLAYLQQVPELQELWLHGCKYITDAGLIHVGKLKQLRYLDLGATKIGDAGVAHLSNLINLEHLDLFHYTKITNAALAHIAELNKLKYLRISFTKVGDRGVPHLAKLSSLKNLVLGRTKVSEDGVARLQAALPDCDVSIREY